jgi:hypothetical protein
MLAFKLTTFYGTLPDWFAALGTVGAFIAGLLLLRKELDARREAQDDRRRAQARLVAAWASNPRRPEDESSVPEFVVVTRNGSDEPVYDVLVELFSRLLNFQPPGMSQRQQPVLRLGFDVLPPQYKEVQRVAQNQDGIPGWLTISFRDSQGYRWRRHGNGWLELLEGPHPPRRPVKDRLDAWARGEEEKLDT